MTLARHLTCWTLLLGLPVTALSFAALATPSDSVPHLNCPLYPKARRVDYELRPRGTAVPYRRVSRMRSAPSRTAVSPEKTSQAPRVNLIDDAIFGALDDADVASAPLTSDTEFLRRVTLDLTGRIPPPDQVEAFLADEGSNKRQGVIDSLMDSEAFVDAWTRLFADKFQVGSNYYNIIGAPGRNQFHKYLRRWVAKDESYRRLARDLITSGGDSHLSGPPNFIMRGIQVGDPTQDTWDFLTNRVTTIFLGVQTQCVSCHNGAGHLEDINLYLAARTRAEFMRQSAFFSRLQVLPVTTDPNGRELKGFITDRDAGAYHGIVDPANPGPRPARPGGPFEPVYMFSGAEPQSGDWRRELSNFVTADRQFARALVNYIWAHFFSVGIVDPPDGWDLARIDPENPPPAPWTLQPTHPQLLEDLADEFMRSGYRIRPIIRLIAESSAYQLSSQYPGEWKAEYAKLFARHFPRRLAAEEIYDAVNTATQSIKRMYVQGFDEPMYYAMQMPDTYEPRSEPVVRFFLSNFGIGDWWNQPRTSQSSVVQVLFMMNSYLVNFRTFGNRDANASSTVAKLAASDLNDEQVLERMFLRTLSRKPTPEEVTILLANRQSVREEWLADVQWALLNKTEFLFNQ